MCIVPISFLRFMEEKRTFGLQTAVASEEVLPQRNEYDHEKGDVFFKEL